MLAIWRPPASRTMIVAPPTGFGAQPGRGGLLSTGQVGPAVAMPTIHGPPLVGIPAEGVLVARGVGAGVGRGVGCRAGVGGTVGAGVGLACAIALGAGWALAIGPLATGSASPVSLTFEATPSDVTAYTHVWREMQPAGQSPQPIWTVTLQPDAAGTTSYH